MSAQILIVENEEMLRELHITALSREGYACHGAGSVEEACRLLAEQPIDLALVDILLPGRSGMHLLQELRQNWPDTAALMVTAVDDLDTAMTCLRKGAEDYFVKPFNVEQVLLSVRHILKKRSIQLRLERKVKEQTEQISSAFKELNLAYDHTLSALAKVLDAREKEVGSHSDRVRAYTMGLALALGLTEPDLSNLTKGALLHDIGKIGVPDHILLKAGELTAEEWKEIRKHSQVGYGIIAGVKFLEEAAEIVLTHHERYDGSGYPAGLKGKEIPLGARIFAFADTLDAMTSDRPYRKALPFSTVTAEIRRCADTQFDPAISEVFLAIPQSYWEEIGQRKFH